MTDDYEGDEEPTDPGHTPEPLHGTFTPLWQCTRIPVEWGIEDQVPVGVHFLAGPPKKAKKSTAALAWALMMGGSDCNVFPVHMRNVHRKGRVAIFSPEAEGGILAQAAEEGLAVYGNPEDESIIVADEPWTFRLDTEKGFNLYRKWMYELRPVLSIIDPLNRMHSGDENSASEMMAILGPLGKLAHELHMCTLIVHHITKPPKDAKPDTILSPYDMRGTGALYGMADGVTTITPRKDGFLHFESIFKRAPDVSRTIRLGIWGQEAKEWMSDLDKEVYKRIREAGGADLSSICESLNKDEIEILEVAAKLERNRYVTRDQDYFHIRD